ncbi:hypothetical protein ABZ351_16830 [Streptomyces microflavus]|uniref:hypothetical protein n=1 Tax=Streptomyces microflavus TaxID=1919 RepID=UPI00340C9639
MPNSTSSLTVTDGIQVNPRERLKKSFQEAFPVILFFVLAKLLGVLVLIIWSRVNGKSAKVLLSQRWDSLWYTRVAEHGYDYVLQAPDGRVLSNMAFFPLFPWLERGVAHVTSVSLSGAGLMVSAVSSLLAAWGIYAVTSKYGARSATIAVGLWATLPVGIVQSMAYSESLFVALAAWGLYCCVSQHWLTAGLLATFAGLTRPVGLAVVAALMVAVVVTFTRSKENSAVTHGGTASRRIAACLIAPVGALSYILWVGAKRGNLLAYLDVQREWGNGFDGGWKFSRFITASIGGSAAIAAAALFSIIALTAWVHISGIKRYPDISIWVYSLIVTLLAVGASGYFGSKPRLLIPAFPLLIPLAAALARKGDKILWGAGIALAIVSAIYGAFWLNGSGPP